MARTPYASPEEAASPTDGDDAQPPSLEDVIIVIHEDGYELIDADSPRDDAVESFTESLPGDNPNAAAFDAAAHPETSDVELAETAHDTIEVKETLQQAWLDAGRLDVLVADDLIKCVNPHYDDLTWFIAIEDGENIHKDISDDDVVIYHELDDYEADHDITVEKAQGSVAQKQVETEVVSRDEFSEFTQGVSVDSPFPVEGTVTATNYGLSVTLPCDRAWVRETEHGDFVKRAAAKAEQEYGEGTEVRVRFTADRSGDQCGDFELLGPAEDDSDKDNPEGEGREDALQEDA